jgi:hypothetical protein
MSTLIAREVPSTNAGAVTRGRSAPLGSTVFPGGVKFLHLFAKRFGCRVIAL